MKKILSTGALRLVIIPLAFLCSIVGNGMVMHAVGLKTFGVVSLIISLPNLVPFMDLGLGTSLINAFSTQTRERAMRQARVAWSMLWIVAVSLFLVCSAIQILIGWDVVLGVDLSHFHGWGLTGFFVTTLATVPFGIGQRILTGLDRVPLVTTLGIVAPLANLPILALGSRSGTPELFLFAASTSQLIVAIIMFCVATRLSGFSLHSWLTSFSLGTKALRREIAIAAGPMIVITAGLPLALETHRLVLARLAPSQLGYYSVAMVLYAPVFGIAVQMASNLWPYFNNLRVVKGERTALERFWHLQGICIPVALIYAGGFLLLAPYVNAVWSHQHLPWSVWLTLSGLLFVQIVQYVPGMYLTSAWGLRFQAICVSAMCLITLIVMLLVTRRLGAPGPVTGSIMGVLLGQIFPEWVVILWLGRRLRQPRRAA